MTAVEEPLAPRRDLEGAPAGRTPSPYREGASARPDSRWPIGDETHEQALLRFQRARGKHVHEDTVYYAEHPKEAVSAAYGLALRLEESGYTYDKSTFTAAFRTISSSLTLLDRTRELVRRRSRATPLEVSTRWSSGSPGVIVSPAAAWTTPPGPAWDGYRSDYERRLAAALSRLRVTFEYEPIQLDYRDALGGWHTYTPDFALLRWPGAYIEVKGIHGPTSDAAWKMTLVLLRHRVELLVWDSAAIEHIEDMESAAQLDALRGTTRFR